MRWGMGRSPELKQKECQYKEIYGRLKEQFSNGMSEDDRLTEIKIELW